MARDDVILASRFAALSDRTRLAVMVQLAKGPASVSVLAAPFRMAAPTFLRHLRVLEAAGLIRTVKSGRVRTCHPVPEALASLEDWLAARRA